jgi:mono/diheme cytochrome c family protein
MQIDEFTVRVADCDGSNAFPPALSASPVVLMAAVRFGWLSFPFVFSARLCGDRFRVPMLLLGLLTSGLVFGDAATAEGADGVPDFQKEVLPIFEEKCIRCHGAKRRGGKLDMRTLDALLEGGVTGPALKKGHAGKSLLIELIHFKEMPPKKEGPKVTKEELELLRRWIDGMR